jgi:hydroxymethylglutaryl-CoA lyase
MKSVQIVEVGARDGLQNEKEVLSPQAIADFILRLIEAGIDRIEAGAFVSSKWVPQMAGTEEVLRLLRDKKMFKKSSYSVLVPNEKGFQLAIDHSVPEIALFAGCTESFSQKNLNCSIEQSFERFRSFAPLAKKRRIKIRGYLSVCFGCPFEGEVSEKRVFSLIQKFFELGAYEVSLGDTVGVASAGQVRSFFHKLKKQVALKKVAGHFHDTRGQALVNCLVAYEEGVRVFDTSLGGLGGCPYAPGAKGNVATEEVVYMFESLGIRTGIDMPKLLEITKWMGTQRARPLPSRLGVAGLLAPRGAI